MQKVGLIAGQGDLPELIAEALRSQQRDYFILAIENAASGDWLAAHPHHWLPMGQIARALSLFRAQGVTDIIMAGKLERPNLLKLRPFWQSLSLLLRIGLSYFKGDDAMFKAIIRVLEQEGFRIIGADEILHDLLTPKGVLTKIQPSNQANITLAFDAAKALGARDIGQAVIVRDGKVIAEEDIHGTDALIKRAAGHAGAILAKAKKPQQERRVDLPAIGVHTIAALAAGGYAGVVLEAGHSLILHREEVIALADKHGLFVIGV